jgi:hypothetical protein
MFMPRNANTNRVLAGLADDLTEYTPTVQYWPDSTPLDYYTPTVQPQIVNPDLPMVTVTGTPTKINWYLVAGIVGFLLILLNRGKFGGAGKRRANRRVRRRR